MPSLGDQQPGYAETRWPEPIRGMKNLDMKTPQFCNRERGMLFPIRILSASAVNKGQDHTKILNERQKLLPRTNGRLKSVAM